MERAPKVAPVAPKPELVSRSSKAMGRGLIVGTVGLEAGVVLLFCFFSFFYFLKF